MFGLGTLSEKGGWRKMAKVGLLSLSAFSWSKEGFARASYKDSPQRKCQSGRLVLA